MDFFIFYAETNILCIIILLMLLFNDRIYHTQQEKQIWFDRVIIAFVLYFVSDIAWAAVLSGQLPKTRTLVGVFNLSNYILLSLCAYQWFIFMTVSEKMTFRDFRKARILMLLPIPLSVLAMVASYFASPMFWINENNELNALYYPLLIAFPVCYLLTGFVISFVNAEKVNTREERTLYRWIGIFPIGIIISGLVQVLRLNAPLFCSGCTIMMLFFYIRQMQTMISVDDLTRLNNRGQINRFLDQVQYRENTRVFAMMIDINRFKQINDTYVHAEGDRALVLVAEALKSICEHLKATVFLGRYGGDEFTVILQNPEEDEYPERTMEIIRSTLAGKKQEHQLPYDLEVSIGYDELRDRNDTMRACLVRADEMLYQEKRAGQ